jgi:hypothetical protein
MAHNVKFVQLKKPLHEIIKLPPAQDERLRQSAFDDLRDYIESSTSDKSDENLRIIYKNQGDLWLDGVRAGQILDDSSSDISEEEDEDG